MALAEMLGGGQPQQSPTVARPQRWPMISPMNQRQSGTLFKDARLINGFAEYDPALDSYQIYKRFGVVNSAYNLAGATTGLGLYTSIVTDFQVAQVGGVAKLFINGALSGSVTGVTRVCRFTDIPGASSGASVVVLGDGPYANIYVQPLIGAPVALTTYSGFTFPPSAVWPYVPGFAYLDGTLYVMDQGGNIFGSNLNDITTWSALNIIRAGQTPDLGVYITKYLQYVLAFKQTCVQVFYDAGNPTGSPLAPVQGATQQVGCLLANSVQILGGSILWLATNTAGAAQVVQMDNLALKVVSTPAIEKLLGQAALGNIFSQPSNYSGVIQHSGHRLYFLTIVLLNLTLVYDLDQELWYVWQDPLGNYWPYVNMASTQYSASSGANVRYGQHVSNGKIYLIDEQYLYPNDDGTMFPVDIYTPSFTAGTTRRKQLSMMFPKGDQVSGSEILIRHSDDDYKTFSNWRTVDMSTKKPRLPDCGSFDKRALHIRHFKNTTFRLREIELQYDLGTL